LIELSIYLTNDSYFRVLIIQEKDSKIPLISVNTIWWNFKLSCFKKRSIFSLDNRKLLRPH